MAGVSSKFSVEFEQYERLRKAMESYAGHAGRVIDDVLHNEGGRLINDEIMRLLPESGRTWKGKKPSAKRAQPFTQENGSLSVTIKTKPAYHYLYFPDDGTNTRRHVGFQGKPREFMRHGAENKSQEIIDRCVQRLIEKWESD